jgi:hypothetical protein
MSDIESSLKRMRVLRGHVMKLVRRWKRGDTSVVIEIDRKIAKYSKLRDDSEDIASLRDHPGFIKLMESMLTLLDRDLQQLPEQRIRDEQSGGCTSMVNAVGQMIMKRFIGLWQTMEEEHRRGAKLLDDELRALHQFNEGIK